MPRPTSRAPNENGSQDSEPQGVSWFGTTEDGRPLDINGDVIEGLPSVLEQSDEPEGGQPNGSSGSTRDNARSPSIPDTEPPPSPTNQAGRPLPEAPANTPTNPPDLNPVVQIKSTVYRRQVEQGQEHYPTFGPIFSSLNRDAFGDPRQGFFQPTTGASTTAGALASFAHFRYATSKARLRQNVESFTAAGLPSSPFEETMRQQALQRDITIMQQAHVIHEIMTRHARHSFDTLLPQYEVKPLGCCIDCGHNPWEADVVLTFL